MDNFDLVLEGGGVKGIGLVGAVSTLRRAGYELGDGGRVAGTSAGAIVGSLIAAGMPVPRLEQTMRTVDYSKFRDRNRFGTLGRAVADAVRASASIPFFFRPVQLKPATSRLPSYCVAVECCPTSRSPCSTGGTVGRRAGRPSA